MSEPRPDAPRPRGPESAQAERVRVARPTDTEIPIAGSSEDVLGELPEPTDDTPTMVSKNAPKPPVLDDDGIRGRRLAHFELLEHIGAGGMAAVLRARDTQLDRIVALKILPPDMAADAENVRRFNQEARSAAKLDHENIARVFFCGEDQRLHFIAFEYVEGENLRSILDRRGRLPVAEALPYVLQVAAGLAHASDRGVVHRDIKPSNIIITPGGRAKLVDMGLARSLGKHRDDGLTQSGVTLGTFDYISPEQALEPRDADVRSDIYSLGCTFYHMVTGRAPVPEGTAAKKLHHHQHVPPPDPRELVPGLPDEVALILDRMMAKDPRARYQNAGELVQHLLTAAKQLRLGADVPEGVMFVEAPLPRSAGGHPYLLVSLAVAAVVVLLLFLDQPTTPWKPPPADQTADKDQGNKSDKKDRTPDADRTTRADPHPVVDAARDEVVYDDDDVTPEKLRRWLDSKRDAKRVRVLLARDLELKITNQVPFVGLLAKADHVTIGPKNSGTRPTIHLEYVGGTAKEYAALSVQAKQATITGIRFDVDARGSEAPLVGLRLEGGERHRVSKCDFIQANPPKDHALTSLLATADDSTPILDLSEDMFFGYRKLVLGEPIEIGGYDAVYRKGPVAINAVHCAFGPHLTTFRLEGKNEPLTLEHDSVVLGSQSTVFQFEPDSQATLAARYCCFARYQKSKADTDEATLIRLPKGAEAVDYAGVDNRYFNLNSYLTVPDKDAKSTLEDFQAYLADHKSSDTSTALDFVPWRFAENPTEPKGLVRPGEEYRVFRPLKNVVELRPTEHGDEHLIGVEKLGGESLTDNLRTPQKHADVLARKDRTVEPGREDSENRFYPTLFAAVAAAQTGDTIYIRQNGELAEMEEIRLVRPGVDLTIKPDVGYRPILTFGATGGEQNSALFRLQTGKVQIEGMEILLRPRADFHLQSVLALVGDGQVTFKDCLFTLDQGGKTTLLNVVSLLDPSNSMKMESAKMEPVVPRIEGLKPHLTFTNCFVRGNGDLLWNQTGRPFDLDATRLLVAVSGSFCNVEVAANGGASGPASVLKLERTTTFLGGNLLHVQGKELKDVQSAPAYKFDASDCLFLPALEALALVRYETKDSDATDSLEDKVKARLQWEPARTNAYGTFDAFLSHQQIGATSPQTVFDRNGWVMRFTAASTQTRSVRVTLPDASARETPFPKLTPAQLRPSDPADGGADTAALQKLLTPR
jgi:serine/threonine protein kinase